MKILAEDYEGRRVASPLTIKVFLERFTKKRFVYEELKAHRTATVEEVPLH